MATTLRIIIAVHYSLHGTSSSFRCDVWAAVVEETIGYEYLLHLCRIFIAAFIIRCIRLIWMCIRFLFANLRIKHSLFEMALSSKSSFTKMETLWSLVWALELSHIDIDSMSMISRIPAVLKDFFVETLFWGLTIFSYEFCNVHHLTIARKCCKEQKAGSTKVKSAPTKANKPPPRGL